MPIRAIPHIVLLGFLFGTTTIASRFIVGQIHPFTYISLRLVLTGLLHALAYATVLGFHRWPRNRRLWRHAFVFGMIGLGVPMMSFFSALQYLSGGMAALLISPLPAMTVIMAHFTLPDERISWRKLVGVILALGGAFLLVLRGESGLPEVSQANPIGYGLVLLGMLSGSAMNIYARKYLQEFDPINVSTVSICGAAVFVLPSTLLFVRLDLSQVNMNGVLALVYSAIVGSFIGVILLVYYIRRFGATAASLTNYVIPIVASLGGALILGEIITLYMLWGMGLIVAGIYLVGRSKNTSG